MPIPDVSKSLTHSVAWITADDTGTRHAGQNGFCTQIGNDRFTWFASRARLSRRLPRPDAHSQQTRHRFLGLSSVHGCTPAAHRSFLTFRNSSVVADNQLAYSPAVLPQLRFSR